MSSIDDKRCMTCDLPVCYDEDRENIDDDLECLRTKPYCTNKGNAVDWRARCLAAEARLTAYPLPRGDTSMIADPEFAACASCAATPGSPTLCRACLHNRATINQLRKVYVLAARLRTFPVPFDDHFQLVGAVDECRSMMEPPVDKERST